MKKKLLAFLLCVGAMFAWSTQSNGQSRMIYFWSFNGYTSGTTVHLPAINNVPADYNIGTSTAQMYWEPSVPVSGSYAGYSDISAAATADYDTVNQAPTSTYSVTVGNYFRARNPSDSMQMLFYIPSTNYQNITFRYGTETSSLTSGDSVQLYSYSVDSGVTWNNIDLSTPLLVVGSGYLAFGAASVTITDPAANNNPKLVFRITTLGRNHGTSGNNRFDNISVKGDTIMPSTNSVLIHFWDFNTFAGTYSNPTFPYIHPDYSTLPAYNAYVHFGLFPGTSLSNPTYFDAVAVATGSADFDSVNNVWPQVAAGPIPAVNGIRMRNPDDSTYLYYYMPTVGYKNINLIYGSETSSYTSGDSIQTFNYSADSGLTWRLAGITEAWDSASVTFRRIHVAFTDPAANNNPTLFFRIHLVGRNTGSSGNNRFDNISVQGDTIFSALPTITTVPAAYGPLCNTAPNLISVAYSTAGGVGSVYSVQISNVNGTFPNNVTSNIIGTGTTSPISATVPGGYTPGAQYRVRVVCATPVTFGSDNGSNITLAGVAGPISGPTQVCVGSNATLIESGSGTWTSTNTAVATIGTGTGIVFGVSQGTTIITYSVGPGCNAFETITVNPLPAAIGGTAKACPGTSTTLTDGTLLGIWSGSASSVATVGSGSGTVTGVTAGTLTVSYVLPTGCYSLQTVTINPLPAAITGTSVLCQGSTTSLTDAGGGTWSSSNTSIATVGTTGIVTGVSGGNPTIIYTLPTGCISTMSLTVNPTPTPILGGTNGCVGTTTALTDATAFGEWVSSNPGVASIGSSTGVVTGLSLGTTSVSYILSTGCMITEVMSIHSLPVGISGISTFCAGATTSLSDVTPGGTWSSSNTAIASVGTSGFVTSIYGGGGNPVISYNLPTGCSAYVTLSVNASPAAISGSTNIYCLGTTTTLTDAGGGTWSSDNTTVATVGSSSGVVTSVAAGMSNIIYTLPDGCTTSIAETVNLGAAPITGTTNLCNGSSYNYTDATAFGLWTSSNTSVASIGSGSGIVTAEGVGSAIITYGLSSVCTTTATITVNPLPAAISGTTSVCQGLSVTLTDGGSGSWSASDSYLASVNSTSGVVTGLVASELNISYTLPTGCSTFTTFTVNPVPAAITGITNVCVGLTTTLSETTTGGSWISSDNTLASVGSGSGVVTGVLAGAPVIMYELPTGCLASITVTVNPLPANITGTTTVCMGLNTTLGDASTGGTWTSSDITLATVVSATGIVTGVLSGNPVIIYTLPTGCINTTTLTVNPRYPISGTSTFCTGLSNTLTDAVPGGTWTSSNTAVATIGTASGIMNSLIPGNTTITYVNPMGCTETENVTVISLPAPISGTTSICLGLTSTLTDIGGGGWYSSNPSVATVGFGTGIVTGIATGSAIITYSLGTSCINTTEVTINPLPALISGVAPVCQSSTLTLTDGTSGGSWTSSNLAVATIGTGSGTVTGVGAGNTTIVYTLPTGCIATHSLTVNPILPVTGLNHVCQGLSVLLSDATPGGSWSSSNTSAATVGTGTGVVSGLSAGNTVIAYTMPTGCTASASVTVNPLAANTGTSHVCMGLNTTLSNINSGGTWTSSNTIVSTVGASSGIVSGVSAGVDTIVYTLPTGCTSSTMLTVNPLPEAISGMTNLCTGLSFTYSDTGTGSWSSSNSTIISVGSTSGIASTLTTGTAAIIYTLPTGCLNTKTVIVNSTPEAIAGIDAVCVGGTVSFSDTGMGTWSSSNAAIAVIGSGTGTATGISGGLSVIDYTMPTGCFTSVILTVNAVASIIGTTNICAGSATTLTDSVSGGTWTSSSPSVATVVSGTGVVTGLMAGTSTIVYTLISGCMTSSVFTVKRIPAIYSVSGGGSYCRGTSGVNIDLSGSENSVKYQLYDTTMSGSPLTGSGTSLTFGPDTAAGSYSVIATDTVTGCSDNMTGFATVTVIPVVFPSVSISNGIGDTVCPGSMITYVATPVNGGSTPTYLWYLNGTATSVYTDVYHIFPTNGQILKVRLISNAVCASPDTVTQSVTIHVDSMYIPSIYLTESAGVNIKLGQADTLNAVTTGAGPRATYQWYKNSGAISGATSSRYIFSSATNIVDTLTCMVTGTAPCGTTSAAFVILNVSSLGVASLNTGGHFTLFPNPNNGSFTLKGSLGTIANQEVSFEVTDMLGQVVYQSKTMSDNGTVNEQILLNNTLANGMYILTLKSGTENDVFHFVIGQ